MTLTIDHLAVAAETLDAGAAWVEARLGVAPETGGAHPLMGTHNRLLSLGPDCYLEVIAIDPAAARPDRPRWFGLDAFRGPPRLVGWVARSTRFHAPPGTEISTQQRGDMRWRITIPTDGQPVAGGAWPMLIDWSGSVHPAAGLTDHGLRLDALTLAAADWPGWTDPADPRIRRLSTAEGEPMLASILTPDGPVQL